MAHRLIISGYYGFGNTGDEAVLAGILAGLKQVAPAVEPVVLSADPSGTAAAHQVAAVPRNQAGAVWQAISQSAGLLSGGGSLLQDVTSRRSVYYYLGIMFIARLCGRPFCLFGQGIGPLNSPMARRATRAALIRSRGIWVRDADSRDLALTLLGPEPGASCPQVGVTPDAANLMPTADTALGRQRLHHAAVAAGFTDAKPIWVIAARPWEGLDTWQPALLSGLVDAATVAGAQLVFLSMQGATDTAMAEDLAAKAKSLGAQALNAAPVDLESTRLLLAGADLVIAMRLHALILAATAGIPGVAISYDPKVDSLAAMLQLPCLPLQQLAHDDGSAVSATIQQSWQTRETAAHHLRIATAKSRAETLAGLSAAVKELGLPVAE